MSWKPSSTSTCTGCGRALTHEPNALCPNLTHWRQRNDTLRNQLNERQRQALSKILSRVASWTAVRWDQHLRHDVGDEDASAVITWLRNAGVEPPTQG